MRASSLPTVNVNLCGILSLVFSISLNVCYLLCVICFSLQRINLIFPASNGGRLSQYRDVFVIDWLVALFHSKPYYL